MRKASTAFAACDMQANHRQRRDFVKGVAALAGAAGLPAFDMSLAAVEPPPETKTLRLTATPAICLAPQYVAEALLNAEGFTDVQYVKLENPSPNSAIASGNADISMDAVWGFMSRIDAGDPVTILAGVHLGCYQLIGSDKIKTVRDLKGKTVQFSNLEIQTTYFWPASPRTSAWTRARYQLDYAFTLRISPATRQGES